VTINLPEKQQGGEEMTKLTPKDETENDDYCAACGSLNEKEGDIVSVSVDGRVSLACGRCLTVIYGTDRSREEIFRLLWGERP